MYSEILEPAKEERLVSFLCMIGAIVLIINMPHIYNFSVKMPKGIGECIMLISYLIFVILCCRVYYRWACGYKYSVCTEKYVEYLPGGKGMLVLEAGSIIIERRFGKKGTLAAIIKADEIYDIIQTKENEFKEFRRKTPMRNRKFLTNRGSTGAYALLYVRDNKQYYTIFSPSQDFFDNMSELDIFE